MLRTSALVLNVIKVWYLEYVLNQVFCACAFYLHYVSGSKELT